jgi:cystathionine gamma-lyase
MIKCEENAQKLAKLLKAHDKVEKVYYPGLEDHPGYELQKKQARGFGAMISFLIKGGLEEAKKFCQSLHIFALAGSLGGVEGLICIPGLFSHAHLSKEDKLKYGILFRISLFYYFLGILDNLIRVSVGIEDYDDIEKDFLHAFNEI